MPLGFIVYISHPLEIDSNLNVHPNIICRDKNFSETLHFAS